MIHILDKTFVPLISAEQLQNRITELATQINRDYQSRCPVFLVVLNGAFMFASELVKRVNLSCEVTFIRFSSYSKTESTGQVKQIIGVEEGLEGKDVIILEDIVDTGLTMSALVENVGKMSPNSIEIATLLHKPDALKTPVNMKYTGFEIENKFVVGYGLDYDGIGRNLDALYVLA